MNPFHPSHSSVKKRRRRREHCGAWGFQRESNGARIILLLLPTESMVMFVLENDLIFDPAWAAPVRLSRKIGISQHKQARVKRVSSVAAK